MCSPKTNCFLMSLHERYRIYIHAENMVYWGGVYRKQGFYLCHYMNIAARTAAKPLNSWSVSLNQNVALPARTVLAKIHASKFQPLLLSETPEANHLAAAAHRAVASPEPVELPPAVRWQKQENKRMKIENKDTQKKLIQRLRRIEGQVRGLQAMLDENRDCREIMQQFQAAHSALESTSRVFLQDYAALCLARVDENGKDSQESRAAIVGEMLALMGKTP